MWMKTAWSSWHVAVEDRMAMCCRKKVGDVARRSQQQSSAGVFVTSHTAAVTQHARVSDVRAHFPNAVVVLLYNVGKEIAGHPNSVSDIRLYGLQDHDRVCAASVSKRHSIPLANHRPRKYLNGERSRNRRKTYHVPPMLAADFALEDPIRRPSTVRD